MSREHGGHAALPPQLLRCGDADLPFAHALHERVRGAELEHLDPRLRRQQILRESLGRELVQRPLGVLHRERHEAELRVGMEVHARREQHAMRRARDPGHEHEQRGDRAIQLSHGTTSRGLDAPNIRDSAPGVVGFAVS